jgi:GNAT superfamily N-acetyltransferase
MCDEWMPTLKLSITYDEWRQLPRNAAYKYEYAHNHAWFTPRPKFYHALLDLGELADRPLSGHSSEVVVQPLGDDDWSELVAVFSAAFDSQQPFSGLSDDERDLAAQKSLEYTRSGGDGPLIQPACFTARDATHGTHIGAILVTLLPDGDPTEWGAFHWKAPPPPDCVERCAGRPHLTWIFVSPFHTGTGVGTTLLDAAGRALLQMGFNQLASTFLAGNDSSMLWHWRNAFRLLAYPGSKRKMTAESDQPKTGTRNPNEKPDG